MRRFKSSKKNKDKSSLLLKHIYRTKKSYLILGVTLFTAIIVVGFFILNFLFKTTNSLLSAGSQHFKSYQLHLSKDSLAQIQTINCWEHTKTLLELKPWLEQSTGQIFENFTKSCLEKSGTNCKGVDCQSNDTYI